jgi:hypothetical protein
VITITNSIQLYGGWNGAASGSVVRNPTTHPTTLDGQRQRRVIRITGDVTPTIDGFIITRGDATGLTSNCVDPNIANPDGCGGGILVNAALPIISNNVITNNIAVITSTCNPCSTIMQGYGGGILLLNADRAIISGNVIISNAANLVSTGNGGGIAVVGSSQDQQIKANQVISNYATFSMVGLGGGIALESTTDSGLRIEDNWIQGNYANNINFLRFGFMEGAYTRGMARGALYTTPSSPILAMMRCISVIGAMVHPASETTGFSTMRPITASASTQTLIWYWRTMSSTWAAVTTPYFLREVFLSP